MEINEMESKKSPQKPIGIVGMLVIDRDAKYVREVFAHLNAALALVEDFDVHLVVSARFLYI